MFKNRWFLIGGLLLIGSVILAACDDEAEVREVVVTQIVEGEAQEVVVTVEVEVPAADTGGPVNILASWGGDEQSGFLEVLNASGIDYQYEGQREVTVVLPSRIAGGNPPDIAMVPRPGVMAEFANDGAILPLTSGDDPILPPEMLEANYGQGFIDLGTVGGEFYGLQVKANSKSTFWYKPASFEALGVEPPDTWDELLAIADAYIANGQTPYSMGGLDGWTLTDWFENIYVRVAGPEKYLDLFVTHDVEWTDPTVVEAMERFREIVDPAGDKLAGGADGAVSTGFIDAFDVVLRDDAGAEMYYEGGFMSTFGEQNFPALVCGEDYSFFDFPEINSEWGKPVVGGGDMLIVFNDRPEVREMVRWLASEEANTIWASAEAGSVISPNKNVPLDVYGPCKALEAGQIGAAEIVVFDGSDLAPGAVGGDAMFTGLQDFVISPDDAGDVLEFLENVADGAY